MLLLSLNLRGTGGTLKVASVISVLDKTHPNIVFLQETLVHSKKLILSSTLLGQLG
jgi:hypothetical protein